MDKPKKKPGRKPVVIDIDKVEQLAAQGLGPSNFPCLRDFLGHLQQK